MKTIGLLGGMSWESTVEYYQIINEEVKKRLGGTHSAKIIINSVDFYEIEVLQHKNDWNQLDQLMVNASKQIEIAGADCLVICTNTMHKSVPAIEKEIGIPIIHIADATAKKIRESGLQRVGLLGTRFTMEQDFYRGRLVEHFDLDVVIPEEPGLTQVHDIIYNELVLGEIHEDSRIQYLEIIQDLVNNNADGIILGCTEIGLLVKQEDTSVPVFDTTEIHAIAAVDFALND